MPSPYATRCDALHLCPTAPTALVSIAANPPPLLSPVCPNPPPRLMLSCRPLLLRHHRHLLYTPIAASPPPAATNISFALPISPLRLLLLRRLLLRPRYRLLCIASSAPPSYFLLFCHCLFCSPGPLLRKIETASKLKQK